MLYFLDVKAPPLMGKMEAEQRVDHKEFLNN